MPFNISEFIADPAGKLSTLSQAKKADLRSLAEKLKVTVSSSALKSQILNAILDYYIEEDVLTEVQVETVRSSNSKVDQEIELAKIQLRLTQEKQRLLEVETQEKQRLLEIEYQHKIREADLTRKLEEDKARINVDRLRQENDISPASVTFDLSKARKLVPFFDEKDVESFFTAFEDIANHLEWPRDQWSWLIKPQLRGRAIQVVSNLIGETYDVIKQNIHDAYAITSEGYRQLFRNATKTTNQTFTEFANQKLRLFKKWLASEKVTTFTELINLVVLEEFHRRLPPPISMYIAERGVKDLLKAGNLADNYNLIHKNKHKSSDKPSKDSDGATGSNLCAYCKQAGHSIKDCPKPGCKVASQPQNKSSSQSAVKKTSLHCAVPQMDYFKDFVCNGTLNSKNVSILRDTGAAQSIIHISLIPELRFSDEHVVVSDFTSTKVLPLAEVKLNCPYVNKNVMVAVTDKEFPIDVDVVLGNDVAGSRVISNLIICNPEKYNTPNESCESNVKIPTERYDPLCIVTRSKTLKEIEPASLDHNYLPEILDISRENFARLQRDDKNLSNFFDKAVQKSEMDKVPSYFIDNDILMRLYRPSKLSADDSWADCEQLIIPTILRGKILEIAHSGESHLGITKTYQRLSCDFYWPGMKRDVKEFVKCCHICQVAGKPNEVIPPAPLKSVIVPHEPFSKVIIDCVGPLPKTRRGNQYLLTVMCPTTRFPIAIPLSNISAKKIIVNLMKVFTLLGFPKELQCDRGTNFTSDLFQSVLKEFNIKHSFSSAYHPQSQGMLERSHQTLKSLLGKYVLESEKDWDDNIDLLLFVMRSVPNESTGVAPFEMLFGRRARDILKIVKETLIGEVEVTPVTVAKYLQNMKDQFDKIHKFAFNNLKISRERMELNYNKKTKVRNFKVGDNVLVYFPVPGSPLKHKFSGPYEIIKVINKLNFVISTPDRKKNTQLVHVNLIKPYYGKTTTVLLNRSGVKACTEDTGNKGNETNFDLNISWKDCSNSELISSLDKYLEHLIKEQCQQLKKLLLKYVGVCADTPGKCDIILHDIQLLPNTSPIRQPYYRIVGEKLQLMKKEVQYLLEHGLASPSCSPWASPCILVPKPNGQVRMCTDYRRVNGVTQKDSYPLPRIQDILDNIGNCKYLTQIDLLKGYYQIGLTENAKEISAFITPFGLFQYNVLPFGMCNSPATFQRVINELTRDLEYVYAYLDDLVVATDDWDTHLQCLYKLFHKLQSYNLTINLSKSSFGKAKVNYLGHLIGSGSVIPKDRNIEAILQYKVPLNRKQLQTFLGMAAYYSRFCRNFALVAKPLYSLTSAKIKFLWTKDCQIAFALIKAMLTSYPILKCPDVYKPFYLQVDACNTGIGAVLLQSSNEEPTDLSMLLPVAYFSRKFSSTQQRWPTVEQELYAVIASLQHFGVYLQGNTPVTILSDHMPLSFLERAKLHNKKLLRWSFILQEFNVQIKHIPGSQNKIADALSRS